MRFVLVLIGTMVALDILWWATSARIARQTFARIALAIFALAQLAGLSWLLTQRFANAESTALFSKFALANVFHLAHDPSANSAAADSGASPDSRNDGSYQERSAPAS